MRVDVVTLFPEFVDAATRVGVVGRSDQCEICLNDHTVSAFHAKIALQGQSLFVEDLGSTNGTMVNGSRIAGEQRLSDGDILSFGSTYVRFEAS